ncbi:restriction system-associated AAA family ATPase [Flavivirga spongiicola]|uniref:Restriction system-associated AAA family ATPase n=1 Tax=Flavivirga spongiicola TaxID=421621 RepID=A0ABU7XTA3_9FLAO|nr:restriction system-associated AAA family ATPase [Flavivirga sp. MEBiC05379]MDO5978988.1 restriction system-associated AAA family ATPase [Flavivirga sp. MEBiC05379]
MKLVHFKYSHANSSHPLNGFDEEFRNEAFLEDGFHPICLVGINGSGKSKLLECIAQVMEYLIGEYSDFISELDNEYLSFQVDYLFKLKKGYKYVSFIKSSTNKVTECYLGKNRDDLELCNDVKEIKSYLPEIVVGYTSGENESLSSYFRPYNDAFSGYYQEGAIYDNKKVSLPDLPKFLWVDFSMNHLVFIANAILGFSEESTWPNITKTINIETLRSFRITIKLKPRNGPTNGIIPAKEQELIIKKLELCATTSTKIEKENTLILDFYNSKATVNAFKDSFKTKLKLYVALFQLHLLNHILIRSDLSEIKRIEKNTGEKLDRPNVADNQKAFNISHIRINHKNKNTIINYNDLSDGEHQYLHVFGTLNMVNKNNVLFLMDEPETHFNPQWRSAFISNMKSTAGKSKQEYIVTTHSPFLLSDSKSEDVFVFEKTNNKIKIEQPEIQTYGAAIDKLLEVAFGVAPPVAKLSSNAINRLIKDKNSTIEELEKKALGFGDSIKKMMLYHKIEEMKSDKKNKEQ